MDSGPIYAECESATRTFGASGNKGSQVRGLVELGLRF
jgi:hypothetical protein